MAWQPHVSSNRNPRFDNKQESITAISVNCQEGRSVSSTYHLPRPSLSDPPPAPCIMRAHLLQTAQDADEGNFHLQPSGQQKTACVNLVIA